MKQNFLSLQDLQLFMKEKQSGHILIGYRNIAEYTGMVFGMGITFDTAKSRYELDLQWISFGLDLYGENLLENYLYQFSDLPSLLAYLNAQYEMAVTDIPTKYRTDPNAFPNPIDNAKEKPAFEEAWTRFQADFRKGKFLDQSLKLVYRSV